VPLYANQATAQQQQDSDAQMSALFSIVTNQTPSNATPPAPGQMQPAQVLFGS
jgi:hypothetical protein